MLRLPLLCAAATAIAAVEPTADAWRGSVTPYLLLANISGETAIGRAGSVAVDVDTGTILEHLDVGFMVRGEVGRGRWTALADLSYTALSDDQALANGLEIDAEFSQLIVEVDIGYRMPVEQGWIEALAGVRVWDLTVDVGFDGQIVAGTRSADETWADPVIGLRMASPFAEDWRFLGRADLGGFGVGSTFTWQLEAGVGWQALPWLEVVGSYRALSVDYESGDEGEAGFFAYDVITHGLQLGATFLF